MELKKCLMRVFAVILLFLVLAGLLHLWEFRQYTYNYNTKINQMLQEIKETYPEVPEAELIKILNQTEKAEKVTDFIATYGIDSRRDSLLLANEVRYRWFLAANLALTGLLAVIVLALFLKYNQKKDREIGRITHYIEEINQKNYRLEINDMSEDELSMLKTEIYKTTVMLKEAAEFSQKDKEQLKQSLSDISHQLKTPLTSISIILDNLIDDPDMDPMVRGDFVREIKREITNINFLVQSLLKISKLDSGTVVLRKEPVPLHRIVNAAIQNVSSLCDLRNVKVQVDAVAEDEICCDFRWQVEAITNILKNAVEHSFESGVVKVQMLSNQAYVAVSIRDFGPGIAPEDIRHLFERFYRGKNASKDSVGIGLALAKAIVESDGGYISVEATEIGSRFMVKYFR
ncbi:MAG: HAMP domain-containing histidine kinase [Eubacterium sp.]|nr:HAMP domain-containing histidine kinase [Eubacterium sp.]